MLTVVLKVLQDALFQPVARFEWIAACDEPDMAAVPGKFQGDSRAQFSVFGKGLRRKKRIIKRLQ